MIGKIRFLSELFFPPFPLDPRPQSRFRRGLMTYAQLRTWWRLPRLQKAIRRAHFEFQWRQHHHSYKFRVSGADISHLWAADEVFRERVYDLSKVPFEPDMIFDLGANIGLFSILAAKRWPSAALVCAEPHPETFGFLCENLKVNKVKASQLQCALSGSVELSYMTEGHAIVRQLSSSGQNQMLTVTLDSLIPDDVANLLIKIDIEGAERQVLDNLCVQLPENCFIFLEVHDGQADVDWITRWGVNRSFDYVAVRKNGGATDGYLIRKTTQFE